MQNSTTDAAQSTGGNGTQGNAATNASSGSSGTVGAGGSSGSDDSGGSASAVAFQCWGGSGVRIESMSWAAQAKAIDCSAAAASPSASAPSVTPSGADGSAVGNGTGTSAGNSSASDASGGGAAPGTTAGSGDASAGTTPAPTRRRLLQDNASSPAANGTGTSAGGGSGDASGPPPFPTWPGSDDGCVTRDEFTAMFMSNPGAPPFDSAAGLGDTNRNCISQADFDAYLRTTADPGRTTCVQVPVPGPSVLEPQPAGPRRKDIPLTELPRARADLDLNCCTVHGDHRRHELHRGRLLGSGCPGLWRRE